ncbi:DUF4229 domain-containing protein [Nocardioides sp. LS1]|uniref:DUF4229 domain-containing protein n=1 Tax=Nocardioides sp. LS1 TaxID=1027620 RepID=UPI000F627DDB|nr:DUF4229 domain-containing protein [Nocardioides sp. LS1]
MKEFVVYTGLRIALFVACSALVTGIWLLAFHRVDIWAIVISFVLSGVASYFLLNRQREAFARRVDERARRATSRFEEMRAREDADEPQV